MKRHNPLIRDRQKIDDYEMGDLEAELDIDPAIIDLAITVPLTWATEQRRLSDLVNLSHNPRKLSQHDRSQIKVSLAKFGQVTALVINTNDQLVGGHQRKVVLSAMEQHGPDALVDVRVPSRTLTVEEVNELNIRLNRNTGEFDWDILKESFDPADLLEWGFTGEDFELAEWELDDDEPLEDPGPQVDRAAELQEQWNTALGQVWELGTHRIHCADSTAIEWPDVNMVLTDPPYGIAIVKGARATDGGSKPVTIGTVRPRRTDTGGGVKNIGGTVGTANMVDATFYRPVEGDDKPFDPCWLLDIGDNQIVFGGNYFASKLPDSRCWIVWDKNNTGNFADAELAWTSFDKSVRLYQYTWNGLLREGSRLIEGVRRMHPTQKPAGLFSEILKDFTDEWDVVADPYLGSGTTIIACELARRVGIGAEIDPAYIAVTLQRWADMTGREPRLIEQAA